MAKTTWRPADKKYGVAICNYLPEDVNTQILPLKVGETVHILEQYGEGSKGWYRGSTLKNKEKVGIFPACLIHIKAYTVENEGQYETVTPNEDPVIKEVSYVLREWSVIWRNLYQEGKPLFDKITTCMQELIGLRSQLVFKKLSKDETKDVRNLAVSLIDWGNGQLGMDLVPRINGEQVDADHCSITKLHRVHISSAKIAEADKPQLKRQSKSLVSSKGELANQPGINSHHLLVSFKNFGCNVGDNSETLLSLYHYKEGKLVCFTERFRLEHDKHSAPVDLDKLTNCYGLFTDLTNDELEKDLFLVAHIYRLGRMFQDNNKKAPATCYKRPWGVGVVSVNLSRLPSNIKDYELPLRVQCCAENESQFHNLHDQIIRKIQSGQGAMVGRGDQARTGPGLTVSIRTLHGDMAVIRKEDPILFNRGVAIIQKLGVSEIITPGEVRNDFYVTLKTAEFDKGSKTAQKNIEVKVTVYDRDGQLIKSCITDGCGEADKSEFQSSVYYHNNRPDWNETIRISVPIDVFPGAHIRFEFSHCSGAHKSDNRFVKKSKKEMRKLFGFAFVRITNRDQIVVKDDVHNLCVYKVEDRSKIEVKKYIDLPCLLDDLNDPQLQSRVTNHMFFKANENEKLTISTLLCSGKFTQSGDLLGILNWQGDQFRGDPLSKSLDQLCNMDGEEIVKFLHDILDALFAMLNPESPSSKHAVKIFLSLVHIFTLIHHMRFENFKPVLETYITDIFSAPLIHKPLLQCFAELISAAYRDKEIGKHKLVHVFQAMDYIMRFVVRSRELQQKIVYDRSGDSAQEFHTNLHTLFDCMGQLLASKSDKIKSNQMTLLQSLHKGIEPLMKVIPHSDIADLICLTLERMPSSNEIQGDIVQAKLELLRKTVDTPLFSTQGPRQILLPMCLKHIEDCLQHSIHVKLTVELLGDILDAVFNLKEFLSDTSDIKDDIEQLVLKLFAIVMDAVAENKSTIKETAEQAKFKRQRSKKKASTLRNPPKGSYSVRATAGKQRPTLLGSELRHRSFTDDDLVIKDSFVQKNLRKFSNPFVDNTGPQQEAEKQEDPVSNVGKGSSIFDLFTRKASSTSLKSQANDVEYMNFPAIRVEEVPADLKFEDSFVEPGPLIVCLTEMLRMMDDQNYANLLAAYRGPKLKEFLSKMLRVFRELVQPEVFPKDWTTMRMVTNNVLFTAVEYFSQALRDHYRQNNKFEPELWNEYFYLAVAFITQPSLQLDTYSKAKAQKLRDRYQDMRVLMGVQVETLWHTLGRMKEHFIPNLVGPFLELTLVPEPEVRKATLPIIFDMMMTENAINHHFLEVEAALIERLDYFLTQQYGDRAYKDLFKAILLERVQSEPSLSDTGTKFIISITDLLEKLLDYRQVIDGDENRDKRMHCTFNILNFYRDEINREEMYIRYVNKLYELHTAANNYTEAGLTLKLYAKLLGWGDGMLPAELRYPSQKEYARKEHLYQEIINCFDNGKVWEYGIPLCKELADFYERSYDYKKLGEILKLQASFYNKILEGAQGNDPDQPESYCPRQDPSYYRVAYYGQSFPAFVRNKQFIYRGDECLKLATIINHLTAEFPAAQIIPNNNPQNEEIKDGDQQHIQIGSVKPLAVEREDFQNKMIPTEIRNFYNVNEVDTFQFDRPYHRGTMDRNNEIKSLCIERTKMKTNYKFPGILRWYEVVEIEVEMLCPVKVAIEQMQQYNSELEMLTARCMSHPKLYFNNLEMRLQGIISAAVNGGIKKYHEAFCTNEFESEHPDEYIFIDQLKDLLRDQVKVLEKGMRVHKNLAPANLQPLHDSLEVEFKKMKREVNMHCSPHGSTLSLSSSFTVADRPSTPGGFSQGSGSSRSSIVSQDDSSFMASPEELLGMPVLKSPTSLNSLPEEVNYEEPPPPVPRRPRSVVIGGHQAIQNEKALRQSKTGSDPALSSKVKSPPALPGGITTGGPNIRQSSAHLHPPPLPGQRKFSETESVPNIKIGGIKLPTQDIPDEETTPPKLPTKKFSRKTVNENFLKSSDPNISPKSSPRAVKRSSTTVTPGSPRVPPLPERKTSFNLPSNTHNSTTSQVTSPTSHRLSSNRNSGGSDAVSTPPPIPQRRGFSPTSPGEPMIQSPTSNGTSQPVTHPLPSNGTPPPIPAPHHTDGHSHSGPPVIPRKPAVQATHHKSQNDSTNL